MVSKMILVQKEEVAMLRLKMRGMVSARFGVYSV